MHIGGETTNFCAVVCAGETVGEGGASHDERADADAGEVGGED